MKFGKTFEKALEDEDLPDEWKAAAIKYKSLKKCINRVVKELESLGLSADTIKDLLETSADGTGDTHLPTASIEYIFDGTTRSIEPRICFTVDVEGPQVEELSVNTRQALRDLLLNASRVDERPRAGRAVEDVYDPVAEADLEDGLERLNASSVGTEAVEGGVGRRTSGVEVSGTTARDVSDSSPPSTTAGLTKIQIKLDSDLEFFEMLGDEVGRLDELQSREQSLVLSSIDKLGSQVSTLVRPNNKGKHNPNLDTWRQLLKLYQDAGIFQPASESQRRSHTPEKAARQLAWFVQEVARAGILKETPKNAQSRALYVTFNALNAAILQQIKFHSMNQQAMDKILKKFDKRTALTAKTSFPTFMAADPFFADGVARAMHYALASNVMAVVPQLDDFECPVCTSITIKPVRLSCSHVFCVRCLIRLQLAKENHCPICRGGNVLAADSTNIDWALLNFLKMYFPREAREKQRENEREQLRIQAAATGLDGRPCLIM